MRYNMKHPLWRSYPARAKALFEAELREMDLAQWYEDNILKIITRFELHSASGIHPKECLTYFIETMILGE